MKSRQSRLHAIEAVSRDRPEADRGSPEAIEAIEATEEAAAEPAIEIIEETAEETPAAEKVAAGNIEFELELTPEPTGAHGKNGAATTEDFLSELASEIEDMETPAMAAPKAAVTPPPAPACARAGCGSVNVSAACGIRTSSRGHGGKPERTRRSLSGVSQRARRT